jgi:hypothetical protein
MKRSQAMKKLCLVITLALLLACAYSSRPAAQEKPPTFKLDHFKMYQITFIEGKKPVPVTVKDQITRKPVSIEVKQMNAFLTPVEKNGEKRKDLSAHLSWYPYHREIKEHTVQYANQFTGYKLKTLKVNEIAALMLPTEKIEKGSSFPEKLDHFLCYKVSAGSDHSKKVTLVDQFQKVATEAKGPYFFCVPCSKNDKPMINGADHLAAYAVGSGPLVNPEKNVKSIKNQFGEQRIKVLRQLYLLVPTKKVEVKIPPGKLGE